MKIFILAILFVITSSMAMADEKTIAMTTTEWAPFASENLGPGGLFYEIATQAFKAMGYNTDIELYPYLRCVKYAQTGEKSKKGNKFVGYLCDYYSPDLEKDFYFSDLLLTSPLGFVQKKGSNIKWNDLSDLKKYKIGVVNGYINTDEFDKLIESKQIKVEGVTEDVNNLMKTNAKRIDMAVIDKNVLNYLLSYNKTVLDLKNELEFNDKVLEEKKIYACFAKNTDGEKALKIFNDGLKKIDINKIQKEYFNKIGLKK